MKSFLTPFPESDETLSIYYALQEARLPCQIVRSDDPALISVEPHQPPDKTPDRGEHIAKVRGFILGWVACHYREQLPNDDSLNVSRMGQGTPKDRQAAREARLIDLNERGMVG